MNDSIGDVLVFALFDERRARKIGQEWVAEALEEAGSVTEETRVTRARATVARALLAVATWIAPSSMQPRQPAMRGAS